MILKYLVLIVLIGIVYPLTYTGTSRFDIYGARWNSIPLNATHWDFIVIGLGSAGCILTGRLSENSGATVLGLEDGGPLDNVLEAQVPSLFSLLYTPTDPVYNPPLPYPTDWGYTNTQTGHPYLLPRGRGIGGSSRMNTMAYTRGLVADYNKWESLGNPGWGWDGVLPFFKKSEKNVQQWKNESYHGKHGKAIIADHTYTHDLSYTYMQSMRAQGVPFEFDPNDGDAFGIFRTPVNIYQGNRSSMDEGYLDAEALQRPNLRIKYGAHVTKILIRDGIAIGVQFMDWNTKLNYTVYARKEVILSAGAYNSPQLLMLSGVGPAADLRRLGIPLVKDLPGVGQHLLDHYLVGVTMALKDCARTAEYDFQPDQFVANLDQWQNGYGQGPLASNGGEVYAYMTTPYSPDGTPDVVVESGPLIFIKDGLYAPPGVDRGVSAGPDLMIPCSIGNLTLRSRDPFASPIIDHEFLTCQRDRDIVIWSLRFIRNMYNTSVLFQDTILNEVVPGAGVQTDAQFNDYLDEWGMSGYHPCGTAKMGPRSDHMSVVNHKLKVHDIQGLRVVDASIIPHIVRANIGAAVIMIGEKGAQMIKDEYGL